MVAAMKSYLRQMLSSLLVLFVVFSLVQCEELINLNLTLGNLIGKRVEFQWIDDALDINTTVDTFLGIPYAEPPIGNLRFRKTVPKEPWDGDWNATYHHSMCWQFPFDVPDLPLQNEDCLFLNIYTPSIERKGLPVLMWIHGGSYVFGSGSGLYYDGTALVAMNDVVVVSINYRLSSFGFFYAGKASPGNYGLWDQNMALRFIQDHIAEFGGDPNQVTVFGQSAGGGSTSMHLLSPYSRDLFKRAILMSGTMLNPWAIELNNAKALSDSYELGEFAGCRDMESDQQLTDCLRVVDIDTLVRATDRIIVTKTEHILPLVPVVDGDFVPDNPFIMMDQGRFKQCDLMLGTTKDDGTLIGLRAYIELAVDKTPYSDYEKYHQKLIDFTYTYPNDYTVHAIEQQYVDWTTFDDPDSNYFDTYQEMATDMSYRCPADAVARHYHRNGNKVFVWKFSHYPQRSIYSVFPIVKEQFIWPWRGVAHAEDIPFVFGQHFMPYWRNNSTKEELDVSLDMMRYYTNFAKTGNPNEGGDNDGVPDGEVEWKEFSVPELELLELKHTPETMRADRAAYCHFWNEQLPRMVTFTADLPEVERQWKEEFNRWKSDDMKTWSTGFEDYQDTADQCV